MPPQLFKHGDYVGGARAGFKIKNHRKQESKHLTRIYTKFIFFSVSKIALKQVQAKICERFNSIPDF